ncbi:hypothetical protein GCM10007385_09070 [Tateyamaria omphalii]|uniref:NfeD family protein n=1 Tax=Tateyamaria omphalii TaxID=299262 RepID=UPI00167A96DF|nr:hypothetical protein [Tateyamaria omphalii]GGX43343.1 hypothetical protein GCM10007385_09070 [Tateyamaria omphalii]
MAALWSVWWVWIVAAFVLAIIEVFVPVFVFLGMAIGAVVVGVALGFGALGWIGAGLPVLLLLFAVSSVLAALVLRNVIGVRRGQVRIVDRDINE